MVVQTTIFPNMCFRKKVKIESMKKLIYVRAVTSINIFMVVKTTFLETRTVVKNLLHENLDI